MGIPEDMCPICFEVCGLCDCDGYWASFEMDPPAQDRREFMAHVWALRAFDELQAQDKGGADEQPTTRAG